ncbi:MAG: RNA-directed DNA polymerase [Magnetococcales bacterium]|nr:RNA-directed DNA polymerase [Magnetococcales bacterium]
MSIVDPKYRFLAPRLEYLSDPVILTQAWKKTQRYIRRHNWYADILDLDKSAVTLEESITQWSEEIKNGECTPNPMRMVPAPKSTPWHFSKGVWKPINAPVFLRPLAHLGIREQTMATAAMLCLADCIETAQGDTTVTDYIEASRRGIHSYGNRLYCNFLQDSKGANDKPLARFGWGNSETYRRYYQDYQRFLERPKIVANAIQNQIGDNRELYIIKLDISAFFDNINRDILLARLQSEYADFINNYQFTDQKNDEENFWNLLKKIFNWEWSRQDKINTSTHKFLKGEDLPNGIPQGLVASGFFANAYMLEFDRQINGLLGADIKITCNGYESNSNVRLTIFDYCRYVDDIRLLVDIKPQNNTTNNKQLDTILSKFINNYLDCFTNSLTHKGQLEINKDKTEIAPVRFTEDKSGVSSRMSLITSNLSGPGDMETLQHTTAGLDALLSLATSFDRIVTTEEPLHQLAKLTSPKAGVRDDTIKRFAAGRLRKVLRERRSMTDLERNFENGVTEREVIDHEIEMFARKMILAWAHDPSLSLVLRYALDLFPSPELLKPVWESLEKLYTKRPSKGTKGLQLVAWYVCADLLRAGAVETGMNVPELGIPDSAKLQEYRFLLVSYAKKLLKQRNPPWYVKQQALLLLATHEPNPLSIPNTVDSETVKPYLDLLNASTYDAPFTWDQLVAALVFQQLHPNNYRFATWLVNALEHHSPEDRTKTLNGIFFNRPDLMPDILIEIGEAKQDWIKPEARYLFSTYKRSTTPTRLSDLNNKMISLWRIISREDNPFQHEIPWVKLAIKMIDLMRRFDLDAISTLSFRNLYIHVESWTKLPHPTMSATAIELQLETTDIRDPRIETPSWCNWSDTPKQFFALGRLLRTALTGDEDFTITPFLYRHDWDGYRGLRNSWYSRRQGMNHSPEYMSGQTAPFSPWVSELLMGLLQWPGVQLANRLIDSFCTINSLDDLKKLLLTRLQLLRDLYGRASKLPIYPIPINHTRRESGNVLRVVLVQTLFPKDSDFSKLDPSMDGPSFRAKHRRHVTAVCGLVNNYLRVQQTTNSAGTNANHEPLANLIVFPELAFHRDDLFVLRSLINKTKAMVITGLNYRQLNSGSYINEACWLIPDKKESGMSIITRFQGKKYPTENEQKLGVVGYRPYQLVIELNTGCSRPYRMTCAICYDATDLKLASDLKNVSDMFIISAFNKDVATFDNMAAALQYHMFQHIVLVNSGQYGGSTVQAPFSERHERVISHLHGGDQVGISIFDVDIQDFGPAATLSVKCIKKKKTAPADFTRFK